MKRNSREALLRSSHTIADITRRLQAELNVVPVRGDSAAEASARLALAKAAVQERRQRERLFGKDLFPDPNWEILLELFIAHHEGRETAVKTACFASRVPQTTALRYISHLVALGLVMRQPHPADSRCTHLRLTERGLSLMMEYFSRPR